MIKLRDILKEIGEGVTPYKWGIDHESEFEVQYGFDTDSNIEYQVNFESFAEGDIWDVSFAAREDRTTKFSTNVITNKGEVYKVMSTVFDIIKDFVEEHKEVFQLKFNAAQTGDDASTKSKRNKLYMAYLKNHMPKAKIYSGEQDDVIIQL